MIPEPKTAIVMAGIPAVNKALYHRIRFAVVDPAVLITLSGGDAADRSTLIVRDIELQRARRHARADQVACPADFTPQAGLSGDRETAMAQAAAEMLRRDGVTRAIADRTLPLIYAHHLQAAGIAVDCDQELGVLERRAKDDQEIEWLRNAQRVTEGAVQMACHMIGAAGARSDGVLTADGAELTSINVRAAIDVWLLGQGFSNPECIVAGGAEGADCHTLGQGTLRTGQPVIIDIFPCDRTTLYNGDCTRTVVHGAISDELQKMHSAVVAAKAAAIAATCAGVTGQAVHAAAMVEIEAHGYRRGLPSEESPSDQATMQHGTGHGVGLDVHEPPLLDVGGPELVAGDALTIEPGLYASPRGGIRIEDMVIVTTDGCENLNSLPEGLEWGGA